MSSPLEYYANLPLSPEDPEQGAPEQGVPVATVGEEALVAIVGDVHLTKAEVAQAVQLAVAGAVEQAVSGAVRSAVEAAVKANVSPLTAEARFKHKYLGISPADSEGAALANDSSVPLVEVPRIVLSESGVPTVVPASTIEPEMESAFATEDVRFEQAMEPAKETEAETMFEAEAEARLEAVPEVDTGVDVECAEPLAEIEPVSAIESDERMEQVQLVDEIVETAVEEVLEEVLEEAAEEVLEEAVEAVLEEAVEAVLEEVLPAVEPLEESTVEPVVEVAVDLAPRGVPQVVPVEELKLAAVQPLAVLPNQLAEPEHAALVSIPATEQSGIPAMRESRLREEKNVQFVGFLVGTQMYAVPSILIKEVIRRQPTNRLPVQTRYVSGVINLRGQVMPLVSLRELLLTDMPEDGVCNQFSIITGQGNMLIALEVDRIRSMYVIQQEEIVWNVSGVLGLDDESVIGLFELDERLVPILSMERIAAMLLDEGLDMANLAV